MAGIFKRILGRYDLTHVIRCPRGEGDTDTLRPS